MVEARIVLEPQLKQAHLVIGSFILRYLTDNGHLVLAICFRWREKRSVPAYQT